MADSANNNTHHTRTQHSMTTQVCDGHHGHATSSVVGLVRPHSQQLTRSRRSRPSQSSAGWSRSAWAATPKQARASTGCRIQRSTRQVTAQSAPGAHVPQSQCPTSNYDS
eukprot:2662493-Rhodomonas_salina.1